MQLRVDSEALALKLGPNASLIDRFDRCSMVGCDGHVFYLTARAIGRRWITLLDRQDGEGKQGDQAPAQNAMTLGLGGRR